MADQETERPVFSPKLHVHLFSLAEIFGGEVPEFKINYKTRPTYQKMAHETILTVTAESKIDPAQDTLYLLGPALTGLEVYDMLHFTAASKGFGYDLEDLKKDWHDLYTQDKHIDRLARHRRMPGWEIFEADRKNLLTIIRDSSNGMNQKKVIPVAAIINFRNDPQWHFEHQRLDVLSMFREVYLRQRSEHLVLLPSLGPALLGSYSPDVVSQWKTEEGYGDGIHTKLQDMGSTQSMVQSIRNGPTLFQGKLYKALLRHVTSFR